MNSAVLRNKKILYVTIAMATIIAIIALMPLFILKRLYPTPFQPIIEKLCLEYNIDKNLIYGVIKTESGFNPKARSEVGAIGLMQLMPDTARYIAGENKIEYDSSKLCEPEYSITLGILYLKYLEEKFPSEKHFLLAYNAGEGKVSGWLKTENPSIENFPYAESRDYVFKVLCAKKVYLRLFSATSI